MSTRQILKKNRDYILHLYLNEKKHPKEISTLLGLPYHQPIYNLLKEEVFIKHLNGENKYRKYSVDQDFFKSINTEAKAYILGFIAADGHIEQNRITVELNAKDIDILEKLKSL